MKRIIIIVMSLLCLRFSCFAKETKPADDVKQRLETYMQIMVDSLFPPSFFQFADEFQNLADSAAIPEYRISARRARMNKYYIEGNTDSLEAVVARGKEVSKMYGDDEQYYLFWSYLINNYIMTDSSEHAIVEAQKMQNEAFNSGSAWGKASSLNSMGEAYYYVGNYGLASDCFRQAISEYEMIEGTDYFDICTVYYALNLALIGDKRYIEVFSACDAFDSAISILEKTDNEGTINAFKLVCMCARTIAAGRLHRMDLASTYMTKVEYYHDLIKTQNDYYLEARSVYYEEKGDLQEALDANQAAIDYFSSLGLLRETMRFTKAKASLLKRMGRYKESTDSYDYYTTVQDSLQRQSVIRQLNEMTVLNEIQKMELEKKNLEIEVQQTTGKFFKYITALLLLTGIITAIFLIRERSLNAKLHKAVKKAEESDMLKSSFLANMSHEIRTPLNAVVGFSNLLVSGEGSAEDNAQYCNIINLNSDMLLKLVNDVLDLSKLEASPHELNITEFDLATLFNDMGRSFEERVKGKDIEFKVLNPFTKCVVRMDKLKITQLLTNLVFNAIKFTEKGNIAMAYTLNESHITFTVSDTGKGMTKEQIDKIFERFYKVDDFAQGTGLGMAISKALVDNMGGTIKASSVLGKGTSFTVVLPAEVVSSTPAKANA
ncbi:MAG: tetratricopeptide repeat-containing sensor histidine kinase [Bacteroidales bacterium]|nr:tetratricopeptide repeat-containing sensor histidine kinase [Bacteroidales bacterium]